MDKHNSRPSSGFGLLGLLFLIAIVAVVAVYLWLRNGYTPS